MSDPLWILAIVLIVLYAGGVVVVGTAYPLLHLVLIIAVIIIIYRFLADQRPLP